MKVVERDKARVLRKAGKSMNEIVAHLGVSKASVSVWTRDIPLTKEQRQKLTARGFSKDAIEKRRLSRISKTKKRHAYVRSHACREIDALSRRDLWLVATALYWGEGSKAHLGTVAVSNSDPAVLQIMMRFFREVVRVPEDKFRCHVHTFSHRNVKECERYW